MTTVLIIVALLMASALWGWRGIRRG